MGGGIWAMHFIGMLAFSLPMPVTYDVPATLGSLTLAIAVTRPRSGSSPGATTGLAPRGGRAGDGARHRRMHYTGMAAMRLPAMMTYRPILVAASIVIAVVAATAALWFAGRVDRHPLAPGRCPRVGPGRVEHALHRHGGDVLQRALPF
ncbi:MAG: MHYT domain-containing protein [Acetobacteraceae bacterium]